uniref:AlNc14C207G8828 protein n=1 Tax=Albugo laibachii Nc14 TaxID=890382 RepID=F0WR20_9STRA|nr:AlNc14C207G8828 [Albugo laibachii Nc14]|eukprot:CCA23780.1 AlNc14C207G8828 [Albugo laibachii Nc14]
MVSDASIFALQRKPIIVNDAQQDSEQRLLQSRTGQRPTQYYNTRDSMWISSFGHDSQYSQQSNADV